MHEIVTIQLGTQSNYVATHFWNAQESYFTYPPDPPSEIDHNVHFRPGLTHNGTETFTPRALVYDFKEHFGALGATGGLYEQVQNEESRDGGIWSSGTLTTIRQPQIPPSTYHESLASGSSHTRLLKTSSIRSFTDYLHPFYHPRSLRPISVLSLSQSTLAPPVPTTTTNTSRNSPSSSFQAWRAGEELFETLNKDHELLDDDLRFWVEECDALQGVQLIVDADSAWGGFSKGWVEGIRDELGGKGSVWIWAANGSHDDNSPEVRDKRRKTHLLNNAYSLFELSPQSSLYAPLSAVPIASPSYLTFDQTSPWHTSAIQVAALESATLPSRLRVTTEGSTRGLLQDMEGAVNRGGERKIAGISLTIENMSSTDGANGHNTNCHNQNTYDEDEGDFEQLDLNLYPSLGMLTTNPGRTHVFGRVEVQRGVNDPANDGGESEARRRYEGPIVERYNTALSFPALETYPRIFGGGSSKKNLTIRTTLDTSSSIAKSIRQMEQSVRRLVSIDEREALCNGLKGIAEEYIEGWESGSDEGDDDGW